MKRVMLCSVLLLVWGVGESPAKHLPGIERARADSLYQAAVAQVGRMSEKESLKAFGEVLKVDWDYAPAHYELAKLYMSLDTPMDRQSARKALDKAIRLEPGNEAYQVLKGDLLWAQGLWDNAADQYEKVLEAFPGNAEAAYMLGLYALKNFLLTKDREYGLPAGGASRTGVFDVLKEEGKAGEERHLGEMFAEEDYAKAVTYFKKTIRWNPGFRDAYYKLALTHFEGGHPEELVRVSKQLLEVVPEDKDALLFCALGYQGAGDHRTAARCYEQALERMDADERATMESVALVASRKEREAVAGEGGPAPVWTDTPERVRFWRRQDALFLTAFNERTQRSAKGHGTPRPRLPRSQTCCPGCRAGTPVSILSALTRCCSRRRIQMATKSGCSRMNPGSSNVDPRR